MQNASASTWLWPGYLPAGKFVVIDGDPGDGKSTLSCDLVARVTSGSPMPDGSAGVRGNVLVLSAEDGIADTIRPRLEVAGADLRRVSVLDEIVFSGHGRPVELPRDLPYLERIVRQHRVRLVTIDPLMAFLGGVDSHNDQSIRKALHPLSKLADSTGVAILVVRHLNKGSGGKAMYRGGGSIGISGAARAVFLVAPDPDDETRRLLANVKLNIAVKPNTLAFRLVGDSATGVARIAWEGTTAHTADELVDTEERNAPALAEAIDFLRDVLSSGPVLVPAVKKEARSAGIADRTLDRAKGRLGVTSQRSGFGKGGEWSWALPSIERHGNA